MCALHQLRRAPALASASCSGHRLFPCPGAESTVPWCLELQLGRRGAVQTHRRPEVGDQLGGVTYVLAFPVEVEVGTGDWVEAVTA